MIRDVYPFDATEVVTMLTVVESSITQTEQAIAIAGSSFDSSTLERFAEMLERRRALLSKVKRYMREMDVLPEGYN